MEPYSQDGASLPGWSLIPRTKPDSQDGASSRDGLIPGIDPHSRDGASFPGWSLSPCMAPHS